MQKSSEIVFPAPSIQMSRQFLSPMIPWEKGVEMKEEEEAVQELLR